MEISYKIALTEDVDLNHPEAERRITADLILVEGGKEQVKVTAFGNDPKLLQKQLFTKARENEIPLPSPDQEIEVVVAVRDKPRRSR